MAGAGPGPQQLPCLLMLPHACLQPRQRLPAPPCPQPPPPAPNPLSPPSNRVQPRGCPPVEGPSATRAWQALYAGDAAGGARSLGLCGEQMFGLSAPRVQRALERLPGAQRCDRYCGWPEGTQLAAPQLVSLRESAGGGGGGDARPRPLY
jgi:hypothetical protein